MKRTGLAILAVVALVVTVPPGADQAAAMSPNDGTADELIAGGFAVQPTGAVDSSVVVFGCFAIAPTAVATAIRTCTFTSSTSNASAPGVSLPGPVVTTAGQGINFEDSKMEVCWEAEAVFATGRHVTDEGCNMFFAGAIP